MSWGYTWLDTSELLRGQRRARVYIGASIVGAVPRGRKHLNETTTTPRRLITICAWCRKIRTSKGLWQQSRANLQVHNKPGFSHGICPECAEESYIAYHHERNRVDAVTPIRDEGSIHQSSGTRYARMGTGA